MMIEAWIKYINSSNKMIFKLVPTLTVEKKK